VRRLFFSPRLPLMEKRSRNLHLVCGFRDSSCVISRRVLVRFSSFLSRATLLSPFFCHIPEEFLTRFPFFLGLCSANRLPASEWDVGDFLLSLIRYFCFFSGGKA